MQIPHEVQARPDTGLYNAKLGIWLFLASEVMLFGGLFSAYIFLRLGADDGYWPHGLLNVPVGTLNTAILILSSVTVIRAWVALKMRRFDEYKRWMGLTIICAFIFLGVKLIYEWPQKFAHFGAILRKDKMGEYEKFLGNEHMKAKGLAPRNEISGHLEAVEFTFTGKDIAAVKIYADKKSCMVVDAPAHGGPAAPAAGHDAKAADGKLYKFESKTHGAGFWPSVAEGLEKIDGVKVVAFEVMPDPVNEDPTNADNEKPHFLPKHPNPKATPIVIKADDIHHWSAFVPKHSTYFATYFMITGLHGLHVLGGALVFCFLWGPGAALYRKNPEHLANRVEVAGLFWHFVDLVWIFVFPLFYLL
ncbi:MAG: cytochrome c oxidase subunit 3 [Chthoniobacteraceae bacterium]